MNNPIKKYFIPILTIFTLFTYLNHDLLALHEPLSILLVVLFAIHIFENKKLIAHTIKQFVQKKGIIKHKLFYVIDILLCLSFVATIISGFASSQFLLKRLYENSSAEHIHTFFAFFALALLIVHIIQHRKQTLAAFKKMTKNINNGKMVQE